MSIPKHLIPLLALIFLSGLFSCGFQVRQYDQPAQPHSKEELDKVFQEISSKYNQKKLSAEAIDTTADDALVPIVYENLLLKLPLDYTKERDAVLKWSKPQQAVYIIWNLDSEVDNGGFDQYYYNTEGHYVNLAPDALKLVGAPKLADLTAKAYEVYRKQQLAKYKYSSAEESRDSYKNTPLYQLDRQFYALKKAENLQRLLVDFIRAHKQDFIEK